MSHTRSRALACLALSLFLVPVLGQSPTTPTEEKPADPPAAASARPVAVADADLLYSQVYPLIAPRITIRSDVGDGVGYKRGFDYVEAFLPISQQACGEVVFGNLRAINFDDIERWEGQIGFGWRRYNQERDRILGLNVFYDVNNDGNFTFQQIGVGVESLGKHVDFRANGYFIVGADSENLADVVVAPHFRNFFILLNHTQIYKTALSGFDMEVGTPVPFLECWNVRAFAGMYCFGNDNAPSVCGVRGRLEAQVTERISLHLEVQNDNAFDTTVTGGIAFSFGPGVTSGRRVIDRLGERVVRAPNVVTVQATRTEEVLAIDPNTGMPVLVKHADSSAAAGGDGSFEHPFNSLAALQGGAQANDILFLHAGSAFVGQGIALQAGQRLLGEGTIHLFDSQFGTFVVPRATYTTSAAPIIAGSPGSAVIVANNTEVSGLQITGAGASGIVGDGVINVRINRNKIVGVAADAININAADGTTVIAGNTITGAAGSGINLSNATGTAYILDNTVNVAGPGISVDSSFGTLFLQIARNNVVGGTGVSVDANGTSNVSTQIARNFIDATGFPDIAINQNGFTSTLNVESANPAAGLFGGGLQGVVNLNTAASLSATTGGNLFLFPYGTFFTPP